MRLRVGTGFDSHALVEGRPCILGGVEIPHEAGPLGHSDGDAVLHALCDALLGAAGLSDLGTLFPDGDERWRGAASSDLVRRTMDELAKAGCSVVNVDIVVVTDGPRIAPHRQAIREHIGGLIGVEAEAVNIKGKSAEGLASQEGPGSVVAQAVCLLSS